MHLTVMNTETPHSRGTSSPWRVLTGKSASTRSLESHGHSPLSSLLCPFRGTPSLGKGKASTSPKGLRRSPGRWWGFLRLRASRSLVWRRGASDTGEGQLSGERALRCSGRSLPPQRESGRPPAAGLVSWGSLAVQAKLQPTDRYLRWGSASQVSPRAGPWKPGGWGGTSPGRGKAPKGETRGRSEAQHPRRRGLTSRVDTVLVNRSSPSSSSSKSVGFASPSGGGSLSAAIFARPDDCASGASRTCHVSTHGSAGAPAAPLPPPTGPPLVAPPPASWRRPPRALRAPLRPFASPSTSASGSRLPLTAHFQSWLGWKALGHLWPSPS